MSAFKDAQVYTKKKWCRCLNICRQIMLKLARDCTPSALYDLPYSCFPANIASCFERIHLYNSIEISKIAQTEIDLFR